VGRLLLNYVLSDPFVDLDNESTDDVASRIDLAALHDRYVR
jgi:hypothetical protein